MPPLKKIHSDKANGRPVGGYASRESIKSGDRREVR